MIEKQRSIKISPVRVKYTDGNRIPFAVVTKRKATVREAMHIIKNILGFNIEDSIYEAETSSEQKEIRQDYTDALNDFLNGGDWETLCESLYLSDDTDGWINFACFLWMVSYCQEKGII